MKLNQDSIVECQGNNLVCSLDQQTVQMVNEVFSKFFIGNEVAHDQLKCWQMLNTKRFESVVVDFSGFTLPSQVLLELRHSASNSRSVAFAIVADDRQAKTAISSGANIVVSRPLTCERLEHIVRAAYGLIFRERRRYFRCPIEETISIQIQQGEVHEGRVINVSEGGAAAKADVAFCVGDRVLLSFRLPRLSVVISAEAELCWINNRMLMGFKFEAIDEAAHAALRTWLSEELEKQMPEALLHKLSG